MFLIKVTLIKCRKYSSHIPSRPSWNFKKVVLKFQEHRLDHCFIARLIIIWTFSGMGVYKLGNELDHRTLQEFNKRKSLLTTVGPHRWLLILPLPVHIFWRNGTTCIVMCVSCITTPYQMKLINYPIGIHTYATGNTLLCGWRWLRM